MAVLDSRTRKIIFPQTNYLKGLFGSSEDESSIDNFVQTPITDINEITKRLDAIGELVKDEKLRSRFDVIVQILGCPADFLNLMNGIIQGRFNRYTVRDAMTGFAEATRQMAAYQSLPDFEGFEVGSIILKEIIENYGKIKAQENGLDEVFAFARDLEGKMAEALKNKGSGNERAGDPFSYSHSGSRPVLDYSELEKIVDFAEARKFMPLASPASSLKGIAGIYCLLAKEAVEGNYSRPEVVERENNCLIIEDGWWPFTRHQRNGQIIHNSTYLDKGKRAEVLEGVNSGGKTIDIKKALYIAATALAGCWVPAPYARVSIRDKIILREKGTGDVMSAFAQDCQSCNEAYPSGEEYRLVAMDETFTSTEKEGGAALSYGLVKAVLEQGNSFLIISSHYPELHGGLKDETTVAFHHFPFMKEKTPEGEKVVFTYKKTDGPMADYSYAIAVARAQNFDERILQLAEERLRQAK